MKEPYVKVECEIEEAEIINPQTGLPQDGICVTCSRCGHETQSFGTSDASIKRCLALMREECPEEENNFYREGEEG